MTPPGKPTEQELGYLHGLRRAALFVHDFDQDLPGFDRGTVRKIARGLDAIDAAATERITGACDHPSATGDEGPVADLGRMPTRWRCDACGDVFTSGAALRTEDQA